MKRIPMLTGIVLFSTALAFGQAPDKALLDKYCAGCHNDKVKAGGFTLSSVDVTQPAKHSEQLEKVALKLRRDDAARRHAKARCPNLENLRDQPGRRYRQGCRG